MILSFKINKPADDVFNYLTDMKKFASIHPVIDKIDSLGNNNYLVYEKLKAGFVPCSFTYPASVQGNYGKLIVIIKAKVMKLANIEMTFWLQQNGNYTLVYETIDIKTFLPIKSFMKKVFTTQHNQLFKNMEN